MSLDKFFLSINTLTFGIDNIGVEIVKNIGSKHRDYNETYKIIDKSTKIEYFIRSGEMGLGWCAYSTGNRSQGVKQYSVFTFEGKRKVLGLRESIFVIERHINKKRSKGIKSIK